MSSKPKPTGMMLPASMQNQPRMILQLNKGVAILRMCDDLPIRDDVGIQTGEYTIYVNRNTYAKVYRMAHGEEGETEEQIRDRVEKYLLKTLDGITILTKCFDIEKAEQMLTDHLEKNQRVDVEEMPVFDWEIRKVRDDIYELVTHDKLYTAKVDFRQGTVGVAKFNEPFSPLNVNNVKINSVLIHNADTDFVHRVNEVFQILSMGQDYLVELNNQIQGNGHAL